MAYHKSAQKKIRSDKKKAIVNKARLSRVRTLLKKALAGFMQTDISAEERKSDIIIAQSALFKAVKHKILHKNTASRLVSKLMIRLNTQA